MGKRVGSILLVALCCLSAVTTVVGGLEERLQVLSRLQGLETVVYIGNAGSVGMDQAGHPSILFRLLDAKIKNDNSLIGSTDVLVEQLAYLTQGIAGLSTTDDDYALLEAESLTATGLTFVDRLELLRAKLEEVQALLPEAGINNPSQKALAIQKTGEGLVRLGEVITSLEPAEWPFLCDAVGEYSGQYIGERIDGVSVKGSEWLQFDAVRVGEQDPPFGLYFVIDLVEHPSTNQTAETLMEGTENFLIVAEGWHTDVPIGTWYWPEWAKNPAEGTTVSIRWGNINTQQPLIWTITCNPDWRP